ncbi:MAG: hypothetical protein HZA50_12035 [Planctomycetes bacterium]|nr:hypothetical protein [Planctomycetota bacterium]
MAQNSGNDRRKCECENSGREMPAVRTTIVGGRPPGCGKDIGDIPRGIDVLIKKAAVDQDFRKLLLALRARAADEIGLILQPEEAALLEIVPASQLDAIIARTHVEPSKRPAFLGKAAAVMLVALGASGVQQARADDAADAMQQKEAKQRALVQAQPVPGVIKPPIAKIDPIMPDATTQPASSPSTRPASQPASQPALTPQQRAEVDKLVEQLDSNEFAKRDAAYNKLKDMGPILPQVAAGVRNPNATPRKPSEPATQPASVPATQPASQPASQPALTPQQRVEVDKLVEQLDSDEFAKRDAAYNKLKEMGQPVVPVLKEIATNRKLSDEVATRIKLVIESINPPATIPVNPTRMIVKGAEPNGPVRSVEIRVRAGAEPLLPDNNGNDGVDEIQIQPVAQVIPLAGDRIEKQPPKPTTQPASAPATQPASQPASQPALAPQQRAEIDKLIEQLDSNEFATRDAAYKKLKEMGQTVVPVLKEIAAGRKLSDEVSTRIKLVIESINPPPIQPVLTPQQQKELEERKILVEIEKKRKMMELEVVAQPASVPASVPSSQSALTPKQRAEVDKLVEQLDSDEFAKRDAAYNKLKEMGQPVVPVLKEIAANKKLSAEVAARIKLVIESLNPQPVKPVRPVRVEAQNGVRDGGPFRLPADGGNDGADEIQIKSGQAQVMVQVGQVVQPASQPASNPASRPASQPSSQPALTPQQRTEVDKLVEQLDSNEFADRDAAQKKLKAMGKPVVPALQEMISQKKVSQEVLARLQIIVESLTPATRPVQIQAQRGVRAVAGQLAEPPPQDE